MEINEKAYWEELHFLLGDFTELSDKQLEWLRNSANYELERRSQEAMKETLK